MIKKLHLLLATILIAFSSFTTGQAKEFSQIAPPTVGKDKHSYARPDDIVIQHLNLNLTVDFEEKILRGVATLSLENRTNTNLLLLDTNNLTIEEVTTGNDQKKVQWQLYKAEKYIGSALAIDLPPATEKVSIKGVVA